MNPLNQFYIDLRCYQIPYVENLAATNDQFECIDLTENDISKLDELPHLKRLESLMIANNRISQIEPAFGEMCPKLDTLILTNNRLVKLSDIDDIASCKTLKRLCLVGNMVANLQNYRLYTIHKIPTLKSLDYQNITQKEREAAALLFTEKAEVVAKTEEEAAEMKGIEEEVPEVKKVEPVVPIEEVKE